MTMIAQMSYGQSSDNQSLYILPLENNVDTTQFSESTAKNIGEVIDKSLYAFIGVIPFLDVPEFDKLASMEWSSDDIIGLADENGADFILYGDYEFYDDDGVTMIDLNVSVWSQPALETIFTGNYSADVTSIELLDTIDEMIIDIIEATFSIEAKIANVKFDFDIGEDQYRILANNKELTVISNSSASYQVKILAENSYEFQIIRLRDREVVLEAETELDEGTLMNINYTAVGTMELLPIIKASRSKDYTILLDGESVLPESTVSNILVTDDHTIELYDETGLLDSKTFSLIDGENVTIELTDTKYYKKWFVTVMGIHHGFSAVGFRWMFNRKFFAGLNVSYSQFYSTRIEASLFNLYPSIEGGYYLIGESDEPFRIGAGLNVGFYMVLGNGDELTLNDLEASPWGLSVEAFALAEWRFLSLKVLVGAELAPKVNFTFSPALGFRF